MSNLLTIWEFIGKHKYLITVLAFAAIIGFLGEIEKYRADYEENTKKLNELSSNPDAIEQIAREKYLMKKPNEDIYVFENK